MLGRAAAAAPAAVPLPTPAAAPVAGNAAWALTAPGPEHAIEGFADHVSVTPGQPVRLFVSTTAPTWTATAFRLGADAARSGRPPRSPARRSRAAVVQKPTNTVVAPWAPSLTVDTTGWPPGDYLFRLDAPGAQRYVPLTVRTPSNAGRLVIINAVTTWQAYNQLGRLLASTRAPTGSGPTGRARCRSTGPTRWGCSARASSCSSSSAPCGSRAGRDPAGLRHRRRPARRPEPPRRRPRRWSPSATTSTGRRPCATAATVARDQGVNLAFLGGNEVYRHIRFDATPLGPNRLEINYKSFDEDPVQQDQPARSHPGLAAAAQPAAGERARRQHLQVLPRPRGAGRGRPVELAAQRHRPRRAGAARRGRHRVLGRRPQRADAAPARGALPLPRGLRHHPPARLRRRRLLHDAQRRGRVRERHPGLGVRHGPVLHGPAQAGHVAPILDAITTRLFTAFARARGKVHPALPEPRPARHPPWRAHGPGPRRRRSCANERWHVSLRPTRSGRDAPGDASHDRVSETVGEGATSCRTPCARS